MQVSPWDTIRSQRNEISDLRFQNKLLRDKNAAPLRQKCWHRFTTLQLKALHNKATDNLQVWKTSAACLDAEASFRERKTGEQTT